MVLAPVTPSTPVFSPATSISIPTTSSPSLPSEIPQKATATPSLVTEVQVTTVSGAIATQTVTSTPFVAPAPESDTLPVQQNVLSGGAIAAVVIGSLLGLLIVLIAAFFLWRRQRKAAHEAESGSSSGMKGPRSPRRNPSVLSKTGLIAMANADNNEKDHDDHNNPYGNGNVSQRHSMLFGPGGSSHSEGVSPVSPLGSSQDGVDSRRHSHPLVYDQRLNPSALFANQDANGSRLSMQDGADYSRPLGITNPDPRASFDSRVSHL